MDDDGLPAGSGDLHLAGEDGFLDVAWGVVVEVVEANFTTGQDFGLLKQGIEFGVRGVVGEAGFVGVNAGGGPDLRGAGAAGGCTADFEGAVHFGWAVADADGEDGAHAGREGAFEEGFAVLVVTGAVEMGVGVNHRVQRQGQRYTSRRWPTRRTRTTSLLS